MRRVTRRSSSPLSQEADAADTDEVSQPTGDRTKSGDFLEQTKLLRRDVVDNMTARPSMQESAVIEEET